MPKQVKKQIQNPTLKWAFMLMKGITEVKVKMGSNVQVQIANMDMIKENIITLIGTILFVRRHLRKVG